MKPVNFENDDGRLSAILRESRPQPSLPTRFQQEVWRRIEHAPTAVTADSVQTWIESMLERILQPRLALVGAIALVILGGLAGMVQGSMSAKVAAQARYVAAVAPS